jgi:biopolymer transport protein ExbB
VLSRWWELLGPFLVAFVAILALALEVVVERLLVFRACRRREDLGPPEALRGDLTRGELGTALERLRDKASIPALVLRLAIEEQLASPAPNAIDRTRAVVEREIVLTVEPWVAGQVRYLHLCGRVAPAVGLLGTVVGLLGLFGGLKDRASGDLEQLLGEGLAVALWTTVVGLTISIPVMAMAEWFEDRSESILREVLRECDRYLGQSTTSVSVGPVPASGPSTSSPSST